MSKHNSYKMYKMYDSYKSNKYDLKKLIYKLNKNIWKYINAEFLNDNKIPDKIIWKKFLVKNKIQNINFFKKRSHYRSDEIKDILYGICKGETETPNYLDIGTGFGLIAMELGKKLSRFYQKKIETYGVDIDDQLDPTVNNKMKFYTYDGINFPIEIKQVKFKVVTIIMVIHHIPPDSFIKLLKNIYDILGPNGYIIIREHDVITRNQIRLTEIQHDYYHYNYETTLHTKPKLYLTSKNKLKKIILGNINVEYVKIPKNFYPKYKSNPTGYYYMCFRKL